MKKITMEQVDMILAGASSAYKSGHLDGYNSAVDRHNSKSNKKIQKLSNQIEYIRKTHDEHIIEILKRIDKLDK